MDLEAFAWMNTERGGCKGILDNENSDSCWFPMVRRGSRRRYYDAVLASGDADPDVKDSDPYILGKCHFSCLLSLLMVIHY